MAMRKLLLPLIAFFACCGLFASGHSIFAQTELFPFVISFDAPDNVTNISKDLDAPAGNDGFVRVEDGHFATDKGRIQFWGTNTCFGANFLDNAAADRMAARMARFGINCVRLHHMDMRDIWGGNYSNTQMEFDPKQLDKLDYYIAALKKRGIYVNINLHVSRSLDERDGFPKNVNRPSHDKGIDNYYRPFIEANKKYARDLLNHVNPYTGNVYKDEPAVAMIEINNENSIVCMWGGWGGLDVIEDPFLSDLRDEWNDWLKKKYENDAELRKAWKQRTEHFGDELLKNGDFAKGYIPRYDGWSWETDSKVDAPITNADGILRMDVRQTGELAWRPQLIASPFEVKKDRIYTLEIKAKANKNTSVNLGLRMNHDPWEGLGFDTQLKLGTEWKTFSYTITPDADDNNARLSIGGLQAGAVYEIEYVSLKQGGTSGLSESETLAKGTVPVIWKKDAGNFPKEAVDDFCDFLFDIEARYWDEMYVFLKNEIKVKQPVSGTQLEYGSTHAQAKMDYCDIHAYWNHPSFPGRAWDGNNWYLHNRALVNYIDKEILIKLASKRVYGKPFTVSEYNHPYPNQYAAEGLPLLAAFGAFQDWDGIFPFAYSHSNNAEPKMATSFFDTAGNTVQMAHMIACHMLFSNDISSPDDMPLIVPLTAEKEREIFKKDRHQYNLGVGGLGYDIRQALTRPVGIGISDKAGTFPKVEEIPADRKLFHTDENADRCRLRFDMSTDKRGYATAYGRKAWLFTGFVDEGKEYSLGRYLSLEFGKTNLGWSTVSIAGVAPGRLLLAVTGEMLNTDMKLESLDGDKVTVGNRWGKSPVCCEGIPLTVAFKNVPFGKMRCWALDESGNRKLEVKPIQSEITWARQRTTKLELKPEYKTVWYEIEIVQ